MFRLLSRNGKVHSIGSIRCVKKFFASLTLQKLVPVILIVVIGLLLVKLLLKLFDRVLERSRLERTMFSFLRAVMRAPVGF